MHKIKKGIKKKIKGKKGKKEEDDLFDPDQLAKYKEELDAAAAAKAAEAQDSQEEEEASSSAAPGKSHEEDEEWKKFKALTSGIDNVLKKTTGDLDRIKSTSFFQRAPPNPAFVLPTSSSRATPKRPEKLTEASREEQQQQKKGKSWIGFEAGKEQGGFESDTEEHLQGENSGAGDSSTVKTSEVEEKAPESPDVDPIQIEDDLFDTSFVDAIETGDIKLSYVPESPVEEEAGDDPFDTTCAAEIVKKIEEEEKKKKRQVNLGIAVNVLTGAESNNTTAPTTKGVSLSANNASLKRKRRPRPHHVNLLALDDGSTPTKLEDLLDNEQQQKVRVTSPATDLFDSILGSPPPEDIGDLTVPLVKAEQGSGVKNTPTGATAEDNSLNNIKELLSEFDVISDVPVTVGGTNLAALLDPNNKEDDDLEDEFAALAAESLHKTEPHHPPKRPPAPSSTHKQEAEEATTPLSPIAGFDPSEPDPFDTSIVNSILPPEDNNTNTQENNNDDEDDFDFDPRAGEEEHTVVVINSEQLSTGTLQKDLLGGSATDLSELATVDTLHPVSDGLIETEVHDPFDTSVVEKLLPGKAELKLLEAEFLQDSETGEVKKVVVPSVPLNNNDDDDDFDFDPRKDEVKQNVTLVNQSTPQKQKPVRPPPPPKVPEVHPLDLCGESEAAHIETVQTLIPQEATEAEEEIDPFDTSAATAAILPGKLELKLLESELVPSSSSSIINNHNSGDSINSGFSNNNNNNNSAHSVSFDPLADSDFDPRASEERREYPQPISTANFSNNSNNNNRNDILDHHSELIEAHTLTPITVSSSGQDPFSTGAEELLDDPFDTSHLVEAKILPGKAELKYLEQELLDSTQDAPAPSLPVIPILQPSTIEQPRQKIPEKVPEPHPLDEFNQEHHNSLGHVPTLQPLTPGQLEDLNTNFDDPFDTSIANTIVPGKAELKILEAELGFDPNNRRLSDPDFNPRGTIHPSCNLTSAPLIPQSIPLVPAQASQTKQITEDIDPFDTSAVDTVLPGKSELKMLEAELL